MRGIRFGDPEHKDTRVSFFYLYTCSSISPLLLQLRHPTSQERNNRNRNTHSAPSLSTPLSPLLGFILEPINRKTRVRNLVISKKMLYFAPDYGSA